MDPSACRVAYVSGVYENRSSRPKRNSPESDFWIVTGKNRHATQSDRIWRTS